MKKILITEFMDDEAVAALATRYNVVYDPALVDRRQEMLKAVGDAVALIVRNRTQVDDALVNHAPLLRVVGRLGVGLDNIDLAVCQQRNIDVIPATGANAAAVAEYAICCAVMLLRGAYFSSAAVVAGAWPRTALSSGREAAGKRFGLAGFGATGRETAKLALAFGMQVLAYDPTIDANDPVWQGQVARCADLDQLFTLSDVVSLHLPLTPQTRHLVDGRRLALMPQGAVIINAARGSIIDQEALIAALKSGQLAGAAIDVFDPEPLPAGSLLADCPNLLLTPHIAGVSKEANQRVSTMIAAKVSDVLDGIQS